MWVVEQLRRSGWARISCALPEADARAALRLLQTDTPLRAYRLVPA
jgi:hypothetical protein